MSLLLFQKWTNVYLNEGLMVELKMKQRSLCAVQEHLFVFMPVNLPARLSTVIFAFPLVVLNSPSAVKSSSQSDQTWQPNNRKEFFILFGAHGLPSRFTVFMKVVSNSLLRRWGATPDPQPARREAAWDSGPIYFSLCLQPVSCL